MWNLRYSTYCVFYSFFFPVSLSLVQRMWKKVGTLARVSFRPSCRIFTLVHFGSSCFFVFEYTGILFASGVVFFDWCRKNTYVMFQLPVLCESFAARVISCRIIWCYYCICTRAVSFNVLNSGFIRSPIKYLHSRFSLPLARFNYLASFIEFVWRLELIHVFE